MMSAQTIEGFFPEFLRGPQFARQRLKEAIECLALEWFARTPWAARMTFIDVSRCGCFFPVATPPEPVLCAMKLSALLSRSKGRDFYDSIFLLQRTGPDYAFLTAKHGIRNKVELKTALRDRLRSIDLENKKRDVEHLLFHSANAARILRFSEFVEGL